MSELTPESEALVANLRGGMTLEREIRPMLAAIEAAAVREAYASFATMLGVSRPDVHEAVVRRGIERLESAILARHVRETGDGEVKRLLDGARL